MAAVNNTTRSAFTPSHSRSSSYNMKKPITIYTSKHPNLPNIAQLIFQHGRESPDDVAFLIPNTGRTDWVLCTWKAYVRVIPGRGPFLYSPEMSPRRSQTLSQRSRSTTARPFVTSSKPMLMDSCPLTARPPSPLS
jgi:hypothetical protein